MDWLDGLIILLVLAAIVRGLELGGIRQLFSVVGFFGGLFFGAWLQGKLIHLAHAPTSRTVLSLAVTLGSAMILVIICEILGAIIKAKVQLSRIDAIDGALGSGIAVAGVLVAVWLGASMFGNTPFSTWQHQEANSRIIAALNKELPQAPGVIAKLGHLISPNGFPQVFTGLEPNPSQNTVALPDMGALTSAVQKDKASVVKIEGRGCGGIVEGSGFVAASDIVITNAHVVAGVQSPFVVDANGTHRTTVIAFDPDLDFAALRVTNLAGAPLVMQQTQVSNGTDAAVLGYPGGGDFTADPAATIDAFTATGRNIYNEDTTNRQIYSIKADVIPGNSGGPLVATDGSVIGVVFAQSLAYEHVGYALTMSKVIQDFNQAKANTQAVATGSCAE